VAAPLGSILLASTDPERLRAWYAGVFATEPDADGFLHFGDVAVLVDGRDDVADRNPEPGRVVVNFHVDDARDMARRLADAGAEIVVEPEWRGEAWFVTARDPDGNTLQAIEHRLRPQAQPGNAASVDLSRRLAGEDNRELYAPPVDDAYYANRARPRPRSGTGVLARGTASTRLPAQDLGRARAFYADKLGLEPVEERPGGLRYRSGNSVFTVFASTGAPSGQHTQMGWTVDDIDAAVAELRDRGVVFEEYDLPGLKTVDGIAEIEGAYPSDGGIGERGAWFRDSEGNLIGIGQAIR